MSMKRWTNLALLFSFSLCTVAVLGQTNEALSNGGRKPDAANDTVKAAVENNVAAPDYVIGADDTLHISVWKEPDLSETLPVRPDGKISMPLLNDITAAGLTPLEL